MDFVQRAKLNLGRTVAVKLHIAQELQASHGTELIFPAHRLEEQHQFTSSLYLEASNQQISS